MLLDAPPERVPRVFTIGIPLQIDRQRETTICYATRGEFLARTEWFTNSCVRIAMGQRLHARNLPQWFEVLLIPSSLSLPCLTATILLHE